MGRKPNPKKEYKLEMPFYCKECGKCKTDSEAYNELKIIHNTGYTCDVYCKKREQTVYGV
ncbi:MAG: hypothetical protein LUE64_06005 [Candidatus Gastranaerophilales bacterium]|nr:hypothetical protein [Candidatus Gastranaerophilales bacterium]